MIFSEKFPYDLRVPIISAPMFLVSNPDTVVESCLNGIVGAFPTSNTRSLEQLDSWLFEITSRIDRAKQNDNGFSIAPWAVNLVTHRSNTRLQDDLALVEKYQPPIVITALGSPKPVVETVHNYGGIVIGDVTTLTLARKAIDVGVDGLACVACGSGGHTGSLSPFGFVSAVREFFDGIIALGGGIGDGYGVAGAIAAGADLVYMGTRFIPSQESSAEASHKSMVVSSAIDDLLVSDKITGAPVSWLKNSLPESLENDQVVGASHKINHDSNAPPKKRWKEIFSAGQGLHHSKSIEPIPTIVDNLEIEFCRAADRIKFGAG